MILPYQEVKRRCEHQSLLEPAVERSKAFGMSYGYSAAGYDLRVSESLWLAPHGFALVSSMEKFKMPTDLIAQVCDKSTWARQGLCVQNTIIEPGWEGYLTLELSNSHPYNEIQILSGMPICQVIFMRLINPTEMPYDGKYQDQPKGAQGALFEFVEEA